MADDFAKLDIPPGFFRNGTEYQAAGRWYDGNLVRWENGRIKPVLGWRRVLANGSALTGAARGIIGWRSNAGFRYCAIGTNEKLYISGGGAYTDSTPVGLVPGRVDGIAGAGYGAGPYGSESYGTRRSAGTLSLDAATWSMDTWGENLIACLSSDGKIYQWQPSVGGLPTALTNAPTNCLGVLVTDEEHLLALGAGGNKRLVAWCSQGDNTVWTPLDTNTASAGIPLITQGNIVTARRVGGQPVIWTGVDLHVMDYLGAPLVYDRRKIADNCGIVGPNAVASDQNEALWMGFGAFLRYNGGVVERIPCDVQDYVFNDINTLQYSKVWAGLNSRYNEAWWFYCSANSTENDRYVKVNRSNGAWDFGQLGRTCWLDRGVFLLPLAVDANGVIWEHEVGYLADGATRVGSIFAQSGPTEIGNGGRVIYSNLMVPDVSGTANAVEATFNMRQAPMGPLSTFGPYVMTPNAQGYVPIRVTGRQSGMRIDAVQDGDWSLGVQRFVVAAGGKQ